MDEKTCFIALSSIKGLGNVLIRRLVEGCGSAGNVFEKAGASGALSGIDGIGTETENLVRNFSDWKKAEQKAAEVVGKGFELITFSDDNYPENLKHIHSAPPVLYVFGEIKKQDILSIAVVGSRFSNKYGNDTAHNFSSELAAMGVCIVSGMARGVDSTAHKAAIDAGGRTIAILGSGLDVIYPPENHELYEKIAKNGAVVSTFPLGTGPGKTNFPERNTFISGLSLGTVVVQAAGKSGALLTAYLALEQNRHVFAVPGRVGDKMSAGTNFLIKESLAKLVENTDDIVNEISDFQKLRSGREEEKSAESRGKKLASLPKAKRRLLSLITEKPLHIDEISEKSGEAVSSISTQMLELEIEGLAQQIEGGLYQAEI